jgi:dUTP pyrophosphatase
MQKVTVKVKKGDNVVLPVYATSGSAGFDLIARGLRKVYDGIKEVDITKFSYVLDKGYFVLRPYERALVGTNLYLELPQGVELQVRSRSGLALKRGLVVANSPGTIDHDYRGEVCVILMNNTKYLSRINFGDAIAQGVLTSVYQTDFEIVTELTETARGEGGFGHTSEKKESNEIEINSNN